MTSIVLAVHNEEKNLKLCLDSDVIRAIADEIIVVDGESTDKTKEVAEKFGAKVITTTNKANFHINKQMAIDCAKGDLILQLDADEVIDEELGSFIFTLNQKIVDYKKTHSDFIENWKKHNPVAWSIARKNLFLNTWLKKGGQFPDPVIRLFIKGQARLPQKDVHEQLEVNGQVGEADGFLWHYSNPDFSTYLRKFNTYTSFKAEQLSAANTKVTLFNSFKHLIILPFTTFLSLFVRHKGFVDGVAGFVFALFSGLHHTIAYIKLWEIYQNQKRMK
ncbi:MAG: glycosyltransferase family 2 protein [Patescibacteria group bacterium]